MIDDMKPTPDAEHDDASDPGPESPEKDDDMAKADRTNGENPDS
jgi:hypothetical protein